MYSMYKLYTMGQPIKIIMTEYQIEYSAFPDSRNQWWFLFCFNQITNKINTFRNALGSDAACNIHSYL